MPSNRLDNRFASLSGRTLVLALSALVCLGFSAGEVSAKAGPRGKTKIAVSRSSKAKTSSVKPALSSPANVALLAQGAKLHKEGRVEEAEAIFKEVLVKDPQCVDAFYDLGAIAEGRGDFISALSHYHAALALRPGDREFKEAVQSVEKALRKGPAANTAPNNAPNTASAKEPVIKDSGIKEPAVKETATKEIVPVSNAGPEAAAAQPLAEAESGLPVLTVPQSDCETAPKAVDAKTFQLSSRKGETILPGLGATQDQFPDIPVGLTARPAARYNKAQNPPTLTVGQNNRSVGNQRMRSAASVILTVGAGAALNASGLHCPVCHMLRFRF